MPLTIPTLGIAHNRTLSVSDTRGVDSQAFKTSSAIRILDAERPGCSSIVDGEVSIAMRRKLLEQKRSEDRLGTDFRYVSFIRILFSSNLRFNHPCYLPSKH